jgi:hypothetical protein
MTANTLYVAFPESPQLRRLTDEFLRAIDESPDDDHAEHLRELVDHLVEELVSAYFDGPVNATGAQGGMVSVIQGVARIVRKTAGSMAGRLVGKVQAGEQQAMAEHLRRHRVERDGTTWSAFPLDPQRAERAVLTFQEALAGERDSRHLVDTMKAIADGALEHYLDHTIAPLELNRWSRGMVSTARATIRKAAYSGIEKGLPGLPRSFREPVVRYFQDMLTEA